MPISNWPTEAEAAKMLKTSVRTIQRYAERGKIEVRKREREGVKPVNVCNPRDVEKLLPQAHVMLDAEEDPPEATAVGRVSPAGQQALTFGYLLQELLRRTAPQLPPPAPPPWITLEEAVELTRFSPWFIRRQIKAGKIEAHRAGHHGALLIRRSSLEAF